MHIQGLDSKLRYAVISDVHSNVQALNAVLEDIERAHVDKIICLGDIVGYGPNPSGAVHRCREACDVVVTGNHDAAVSGRISDWNFSSRAHQGVVRGRRLLSRQDKAWLGRLAYVYRGRTFVATHGTLDCPEMFGYIDCVNEALAAMGILASTGRNVLFVGHTHSPKWISYKAGSTVMFHPPSDIIIDPEGLYIVDVGSVGWPREAGGSTYVIYDSNKGCVGFRSVPFDAKGYASALDKSKINRPSWLQEMEGM